MKNAFELNILIAIAIVAIMIYHCITMAIIIIKNNKSKIYVDKT